jgi:hypothetical protein
LAVSYYAGKYRGRSTGIVAQGRRDCPFKPIDLD